jgi:hypothetical protein
MSHKSIRLRPRSLSDTLSRYVFSDYDHARQWLTQVWVKPADYTLEVVEVGELCRCRGCDGAGFTQTVKVVGKLTVEEFLRGDKVL